MYTVAVGRWLGWPVTLLALVLSYCFSATFLLLSLGQMAE